MNDKFGIVVLIANDYIGKINSWLKFMMRVKHDVASSLCSAKCLFSYGLSGLVVNEDIYRSTLRQFYGQANGAGRWIRICF